MVARTSREEKGRRKEGRKEKLLPVAVPKIVATQGRGSQKKMKTDRKDPKIDQRRKTEKCNLFPKNGQGRKTGF